MFGLVSGVVCNACKKIVSQKEAQKVDILEWRYSLHNEMARYTGTEYYCPEHKLPYDYRIVDHASEYENDNGQIATREEILYFRDVEVTRDGKVTNPDLIDGQICQCGSPVRELTVS